LSDSELVVALVALERACFGDGAWSEEQVSSSARTEGGVAVRVGEDAYALGKVVLDEVELYRIGVRPAARRGGLGRSTLMAFEAAARAKGAATLHLEVRADNVAAIELYRRRGMQQLGRRPRYYRDGCDAVLLSVDLHTGWS